MSKVRQLLKNITKTFNSYTTQMLLSFASLVESERGVVD
jgi:hypothetical protein